MCESKYTLFLFNFNAYLAFKPTKYQNDADHGRFQISHKKNYKAAFHANNEKWSQASKATPNYEKHMLLSMSKCILIVFMQGKTIGSHINNGYQLWRRLIYAGAKAIGMKEMKLISRLTHWK